MLLGKRDPGDLSQGLENLMPFVYKLHFALALDEVGGWILGITALVWTPDCFVGFYLALPAPRTIRSNHHGDTLSQVVLKPGEHVAFNDNQLGEVQTADVSIADAWRRGRLVMSFVALQDVVNEINRYRPGHVFLLDSQLAQRKIHVAKDINRIDDWLDALEDTLPIKVHHAGHIMVLQGR